MKKQIISTLFLTIFLSLQIWASGPNEGGGNGGDGFLIVDSTSNHSEVNQIVNNSKKRLFSQICDTNGPKGIDRVTVVRKIGDSIIDIDIHRGSIQSESESRLKFDNYREQLDRAQFLLVKANFHDQNQFLKIHKSICSFLTDYSSQSQLSQFVENDEIQLDTENHTAFSKVESEFVLSPIKNNLINIDQFISKEYKELSVQICNGDKSKSEVITLIGNTIVNLDIQRGSINSESQQSQRLDTFRNKLDSIQINIIDNNNGSKLSLFCSEG